MMKRMSALLVLLFALLFVNRPATAASGNPDPAQAIGQSSRLPALDGSCSRVPLCLTGSRVLNGEAYVNSAKLWQTNFSTGMLELLDLTTCQVIQRCPAPNPSAPSELAMYGGLLVEYDFGTGVLTAIDTTNCAVVWTCNPPGDDLAEGLTADGTYLYKADSRGIYRFSVDNVGTVTLAGFCANVPGDSYDGLTFCKQNGETLVALGYSGVLYQIDFNTCQVLASCQLNLGADGNGLASNFVDHVYVDNVNGNVDELNVGCSLPPVPVEATTWSGIKARFH